jgi:hypothetical protein
MKNVILSIVVVLFMNVMFANVRVLDPKIKLRKTEIEISRLLNSYPYFKELKNQVLVKVTITLNDDDEVVVVGIDSKDEDVENYVRLKLNFKKLVSRELKKGKKYVFPLRFQNN